MLCMSQSRNGEFQEVECGNYFTFGDLEDCSDNQDELTVEKCIDFLLSKGYNPYRIAVIKQNIAYVYTHNIPNEVESYKDFEKWEIKNHVIYK